MACPENRHSVSCSRTNSGRKHNPGFPDLRMLGLPGNASENQQFRVVAAEGGEMSWPIDSICVMASKPNALLSAPENGGLCSLVAIWPTKTRPWNND